MKKLILIPILLMQVLVCHAQMDAGLQHLARQHSELRTQGRDVNAQPVRVIAQLKEGISLSDQSGKLSPLGVRTISDYGRICVLSIPVSSLKATSDLNEVEYLSTDHKRTVHNDLARADMGVDIAQNSFDALAYGLDGTYDGTGVLVGIIDVGIDFNHAAFRDKDGNTRVKFAQIYDMSEGENPKDMDSVRHNYTKPEDILALTSDGGAQTHGSHTSATAVGTAVTLNDSVTVQGMAPGADILLSSLYHPEGGLFDSYILDAINSQIQFANQVGKPIVINLSLGETSLFCDGKDPSARFYESLTGPGRIICYSAGNSANDNTVLEYVPESDTDTIHLLPVTINQKNNEYIMAIASEDTTSFKIDLNLTDAVSDTAFQYYSRSDSIRLKESDLVTYSYDSLHDNRFNAILKVPSGFTLSDTYPWISVNVIGKKGKKIRFVTSSAFLPDKGQKFVKGNNINTYGKDCETDSVISVGSYVTREVHTDNNGVEIHSSHPRHFTSGFSSYGTTLTGKTIPDVLAPGEYLLSAYNAYDKDLFVPDTDIPANSNVYGYAELFGRKSWYGWMRGTSMACPSAVGVIALWLQADPTLGPSAVREIMRQTCLVTNDMWIFMDPEEYGGGLLRAAEGLKYIIGTRTNVPKIDVPAWSTPAIYELNPHIYIKDGRKYWHGRE